MTLRPAPATVVAIITTVAAAMIPLREILPGSAWMYQIAIGLVMAALVAVVIESSWPGAPLGAVAGITALGAVIWQVVVVSDRFRTDPFTTDPWDELGRGVFDGWNALLDDQVPISDPRSAEIFVGMLAWALTAAAIHVAARRHNAIAAMAGAGAILWLTVAASLPAGATAAVAGTIVGCMALLLVATMTNRSSHSWRASRVLSLLGVVALSGIGATAVGVAAPSTRTEPFDPRTDRGTAVVDMEVPDLLSELTTRTDDGAVAFTVRSQTGDPLPELRLRVQVYDVHDGERWLPVSDYRTVVSVPAPEELSPGEVITLIITQGTTDGPLFALPDQVITTDLTNVNWSASSQTALSTRRRGSYTVTGVIIDRTGLEGLGSGREEVDPSFIDFPAQLPDTIRQTAQAVAANSVDAISAVEALSAFTHSLGRTDQVPPGHSLGRLRDDLAAAEPTGPEQLASLHALMARTLGYPARVVAGYPVAGPDIPANSLRVWTEVAFPGVGWVAFDPVPDSADLSTDLTTESTTTTTIAEESTAVQAQVIPRELDAGEGPNQAILDEEANNTWRNIGIGLVVLVIIAHLGVWTLREWRRRRRRRHDDADVRILGAWAEMVDRLRESGAPIARTTTIDDVVFMAEQMDDDLGEAVGDLADLAAQAMHGPYRSSPRRADRAWGHLADAEDALFQVRGRRARLSRLFDPRVIRHHAPEPPESRRGGHRTEALKRQRSS